MANLISFMSAHPNFLRRVLWLDAILGAASVPSHLLNTSFMSNLLGLSQPVLVWSGWLLVAFAVFIMLIVTQTTISHSLVKVLIAGNVLWIVGCIELLLVGPGALTILGIAYICVQIVIVGLLTMMEWRGLHKDQIETA
jgi:Na+/melibiose symporter-like transporter